MVYSLYPLHIMMLWKGVFAMLVIPIRRICDAKMKQIMDGYTAYSESKQVINKLKKEIEQRNIPVIFDYTNKGCYITPIKNKEA